MLNGYVVGIVVVVVVSSYELIKRYYWSQRWKDGKVVLPPGSMGLPFIGETIHLLVPNYSHDLHPFIKARFERYGPIFRTSMMGRPVVVSADPELNNYVFQQEGKSVELWYLDTLSKVVGIEGDDQNRMNGIGVVHKCLRTSLLKQVGVESLKESNFLGQIEQFFNTTLSEWSTKPSVEIKRAALVMILNLTAKRLINHDSSNSSINLSEEFNTIIAGCVAFPFNIPGTAYHKCTKAKQKVLNIFRDILKQRRINVSEGDNEINQGDMVDHVLDYMDSQKLISENSAVHIFLVSLLAGSEAPSQTIALLFTLLADNPMVIRDLEAEHESLLMKRENKCSSLSWEEYKSMTFTHQVINETLRLQNGAPGLLRRAREDIRIKGLTIPKGWTIMVVTTHLHLCPNTFQDPLEFNPWRWKDLNPYDVSNNFMPFSRGVRQCPAGEYTRLLLATFLHVLVTKYRWSKTKNGGIVRKPLLGFKNGVHINFVEKRN